MKAYNTLRKLTPLRNINYLFQYNKHISKFNFTEIHSEKEALEIVESGIFEILKNSPKCSQEKLSRAVSFNELGFDSLDQVELVVAMEENFNVNITDEESEKIKTVLDAIQIFNKAYCDTHLKSTKVDKKPDENLPKH